MGAATAESYALPLHDALPAGARAVAAGGGLVGGEGERRLGRPRRERARGPAPGADGWCRVNGRQLNIHDGGGARGDAHRLHHGDVARLRKPDVIVAWREDHLISAVPSPLLFVSPFEKVTL